VLFFGIGGEEQDQNGLTRYTASQPKLVDYPLEFSVSDLRRFEEQINFGNVDGEYRLWAVMNRSGNTNDSGHYFSRKWNPARRRWVTLDCASPIVVANSNRSPPHHVSCARVLVYVRLDSSARSVFLSTPLGQYFDPVDVGRDAPT